jgi:hypothetical protein
MQAVRRAVVITTATLARHPPAGKSLLVRAWLSSSSSGRVSQGGPSFSGEAATGPTTANNSSNDNNTSTTAVAGQHSTPPDIMGTLTASELNEYSFAGQAATLPEVWANPVQHPVWDLKEAERVRVIHKEPVSMPDKCALFCVKAVRFGFDVFSGALFGKPTDAKYLRRIVFLETVAGVPGMVG